jgi:hypothetical protein
MAGALLAAWAGAASAQQAAAPMEGVVPHWYGGMALGQTILDLTDEALPVAGTSTLNKGQNRTGYKFFERASR